MFPSPSILQHYVEFDTRTIATLEKLLNVGSFGGSINHLAHCHATLLTSLGGFNLPSIVWTVTLALLPCWELIVLALVIHSQQDDHPIFLDVIAHAKIGTSPF